MKCALYFFIIQLPTSQEEMSNSINVNDIILPECLKGYFDQKGMFYVDNPFYPMDGDKKLYSIGNKRDQGTFFVSPSVRFNNSKQEKWSTFFSIALRTSNDKPERYFIGKSFDSDGSRLSRGTAALMVSMEMKGYEKLSTLFFHLNEINNILAIYHILHLSISRDEMDGVMTNNDLYELICSKIEEKVKAKGLARPDKTDMYNNPISYFAPPSIDMFSATKPTPQPYYIEDGEIKPFNTTFIGAIVDFVKSNAAQFGKLVPKGTPGSDDERIFTYWFKIIASPKIVHATIKKYNTKAGEKMGTNIQADFYTDDCKNEWQITKDISSGKVENLTRDKVTSIQSKPVSGVIYIRPQINNSVFANPSIGVKASVTRLLLLPSAARQIDIVDSSESAILAALGIGSTPATEIAEDIAPGGDFMEGF